MKFKKLIIHNVASIEDATIDFENGPLAEDSQFLICGPTGAGKTTILDAICLALYGTTPRLNIKKVEGYVDEFEKFKLSKDRNDIKIDDTRMLMRRGSLNAFVELFFTDKDNHSLKAVWQCNRAHNKMDGNIKDPEWLLFDEETETLLSEKKSTTLKEIGDRIGLTFEQFCRTTMLAQGDFTRFLKSDDGEKSQILERLTGTDIYSEISIAIHNKRTEKEQRCEQLSSKMSGVKLLTEEEKNMLHNQETDTRNNLNKSILEENKLETILLWNKNLSAFIKQFDEVNRSLDDYNSKLKNDSFLQEQRLLDEWQRTQEVRDLLKEKMTIVTTLVTLEKDMDSHKRLYQSLSNGVSYLNHTIAKKLQIKNKIATYLTEESTKESSYKQINLIESLAKLITDSKRQLSESLSHIDACKKIQLELEGKHQILLEDVKKKDDLIQHIGKQIESIELKVSALDYQSLLKRKAYVEQRQNQLKDYLKLLNDYRLSHEDYLLKEATMKGITHEISTLSASMVRSQKLVAESENRYNEQKDVYDKQEKACSDFMNEQRHILRNGDICPLCGQRVELVPHDDHFKSILQPVKALLDKLEKEWRNASQDAAELKARLSVTNADYDRKKLELQRAGNQLNAFTKEIEASSLSVQYPNSNETFDAIQLEISSLDQEVGQLNIKLETIGNLQIELKKHQNERNTQIAELRLKERQIKELEKQLTSNKEISLADEKNCSSLSDVIKSKTEEITAYVSPELFVAKGDAYIEELKTGAARYQIAKEKEESVERHITELSHELKLVKQIQDNIEQQVSSFKISVSNEEDPAALEPVTDLSHKLMDLQTAVSKTNEAIRMSSQRKSEIDQIVTTYTQAADAIPMARLEQLMQYTATDIEIVRTKHQQIHENKVKLTSQLANIEKQISLHNLQKPVMEEELTISQLEEQIHEKKKEINTCNQLLGKISQQLESDEKNHQRFASIQKELDKAIEISDKWTHLHKLFGSNDGKKFRNIAQSYVLEQLLLNANNYLIKFSNRYEMVCQPGSLTILLRDKDAGGVLRPTTTISGGESFLISLSLALGLSTLSRASLSMDTLFIDEGFGTLDSTYLSSVMDALERLHQMGGKKIGIISHVEHLKERISTQIQVTRTNSTLSTVRVVSLI